MATIEDTILATDNDTLKDTISNPLDIMNDVIKRLSTEMRRLELTLGVSSSDFELFLHTKEQDLDLLIDELWHRVDCEIYSQYLNDSLKLKDYQRWQVDLYCWQDKVIHAAHLFEKWKKGNPAEEMENKNTGDIEKELIAVVEL